LYDGGFKDYAEAKLRKLAAEQARAAEAAAAAANARGGGRGKPKRDKAPGR
jgi:hypothetical protein